MTYCLIDAFLGQFPFAVNQLTISHAVLTIAGYNSNATSEIATATLSGLGIGVAWLILALVRIRVAEYAPQR